MGNPLFGEILSFVISVIARLYFKDKVWSELCHFLSLLMLFLFKPVPVPGDKISLLLYESTEKIVSEYDQEIPQSQSADNPMAPRGRATQPSRDTRKTN